MVYDTSPSDKLGFGTDQHYIDNIGNAINATQSMQLINAILARVRA